MAELAVPPFSPTMGTTERTDRVDESTSTDVDMPYIGTQVSDILTLDGPSKLLILSKEHFDAFFNGGTLVDRRRAPVHGGKIRHDEIGSGYFRNCKPPAVNVT